MVVRQSWPNRSFCGFELLNQGLTPAAAFSFELCLADQYRTTGTAHHKAEVLYAAKTVHQLVTSSGPSTEEVLRLPGLDDPSAVRSKAPSPEP